MEKGGSKLMQMQARFQQKQMQEREMKIASLYEANQARALERVRHSPSEGLASPPQPAAPTQPGKVRQMFEERRTKGIDKSYPLQPIHNTERTRKPLPNGFAKVSSTRAAENGRTSTRVVENGHKVTSTRVAEKANSRVVENGTKVSNTRVVQNGNVSSTRVVENGSHVEKRSIKTSHSISSHSVKKQQLKTVSDVNGSGDLNHNHQPDLNAVKHKLSESNGDLVPGLDAVDSDNNYLLENETFPEALAPVATPRSPEHPSRPPRKSPATKANPAKPQPAPAPAAPPRRAASDNTVSESKKPQGAMQRSSNPTPGASTRRAAAPGSAGGAGAACAVCARRFAPDRLAKHQEICRKAHAKKRKPFDVLKHRLAGTEAEGYKGTEAEPFINKLRKGTASSASAAKPKLNAGWRQKHEEFIAAIRAAKQVQAHLAAGGKLSDLPPPPPSENPDYVPCPHCGRRFNQGAADRHIPKCANFQFNKPKPAATKRR